MKQPMIPKIIHYCWFGRGPIGSLGEKCIASWKKFFPDYEIKEWNEDNFDINCLPYVAEAYQARKYAFVSDYARMWILYNYGGIYCDTDVEVIRSFDDIIAAGGFMGCENRPAEGKRLYVAPGLGMAFEPKHPLMKEFMDYYRDLHFINPDQSLNLTTVVEHITSVLEKHGLSSTADIQCVEGIRIYPMDYFCPIDTRGKVLNITPTTRSIHHYAGSWSSPWPRFKKRVARLIGPKVTMAIINVKGFARRLFTHGKQ